MVRPFLRGANTPKALQPVRIPSGLLRLGFVFGFVFWSWYHKRQTICQVQESAFLCYQCRLAIGCLLQLTAEIGDLVLQ